MRTVYFINGFLEAGKTTFIKDLLQQDYFKIKGRTLLLVCEEGENVYDPEELEDSAFAVFCMDSMERYEVYAGKTVHFTARAYEMKDGGEFEFVAGRYVMTCCEADMTFVGLICSYLCADELRNKEWVRVTGVIKIAYDEVLKRNVPVCRVVRLERTLPPAREFVTLI